MSERRAPAHWLSATVGDVVDPIASADPRACPEARIDYIDIGSVDSERGVVASPKSLWGAEAPSRARQAVQPGDVLFSTVRPYLRAIAAVPKLQQPVASTGFCVLRPAAGVDHRFLLHWVRSTEFIEGVLPLQRGSSYPAVRDADVLAQPVLLPPAAEQERIADQLDELLGQIEAGAAELLEAKRKLAVYRQSLLKSAVEGALTAEWRRSTQPQGTGAALLSRLRRERQARWEARQVARFNAQEKTPPKDWRDQYEPGTAPDASNLPSLPDGWVYASIGQCFEVAVGATPSRKAAECWGGGIPWVSSGEVSFNRIVATRETISDLGLANSSTQINPVGSVLLGMIGEGKTRGQVAVLDIPAANNQNCAAIWVSETDVPPEFVYFWLWSRYDETRRGSSGNNQPALNKSLVQAMPVPIAPVEEMREIAARVSTQISGIEDQEREIDRLLLMASAQRQNILRAAFSGQLVPQDPNDEPASVLLDRIRAQRLARAAAPSVRRPRAAKERA